MAGKAENKSGDPQAPRKFFQIGTDQIGCNLPCGGKEATLAQTKGFYGSGPFGTTPVCQEAIYDNQKVNLQEGIPYLISGQNAISSSRMCPEAAKALKIKWERISTTKG
jgi:hypothetical protein